MPYANAGGVKLFYERAGEGTPLILQGHGHLFWMPFQISYFSQFYDVITFDRRGTGRSDSPPGPWVAADLARDVKNLLDALDIKQAIVGGLSLGGIITSQFGLDYPERAHALIVGHTSPRLWDEAYTWLDEQIAVAERGGQPVIMQPRTFAWEEQGPPTAAPGFENSEIGKFMATLNNDLGDPKSVPIMLRVLLKENWDLRPRYGELQAFKQPTLVIVGGNEPQGTIELAYEWHQQYGNSEFFIMPNTYHVATLQEPVLWNKTVHGFLQRHGL